MNSIAIAAMIFTTVNEPVLINLFRLYEVINDIVNTIPTAGIKFFIFSKAAIACYNKISVGI